MTLETTGETEQDTWRRLRNIDGRQNESFILSDGTIYTFFTPDAIMKEYPQVRQFRIVQKKADLVHIQVVGASDYLAEIRAQLLDDFRTQSPDIMTFEFVTVDRLAPDANGKL